MQYIPHSNLIMLVLFNDCSCPEVTKKLEPRAVNIPIRTIQNQVDLAEKEKKKCEFFQNLFETENVRKRPETCFNYHKIVSVQYLFFCTNFLPKINIFRKMKLSNAAAVHR